MKTTFSFLARNNRVDLYLSQRKLRDLFKITHVTGEQRASCEQSCSGNKTIGQHQAPAGKQIFLKRWSISEGFRAHVDNPLSLPDFLSLGRLEAPPQGLNDPGRDVQNHGQGLGRCSIIPCLKPRSIKARAKPRFYHFPIPRETESSAHSFFILLPCPVSFLPRTLAASCELDDSYQKVLPGTTPEQRRTSMVYLHASIKLRPGTLPQFTTLLNELLPLVGKHGMKLVGSYASVIGRVNTVVDLWELPDASALQAVQADPALQKVAPRVAEIIEDEIVTLLTKLPIG
jgi:NIPSNAP